MIIKRLQSLLLWSTLEFIFEHFLNFLELVNVRLIFKTVNEPWSSVWPGVTIQLNAVEQYFRLLLFLMPQKLALTFKSVDDTLSCNQSYGSYYPVLPCGNVHIAAQGDSNFQARGWSIFLRDHQNESNAFVCYCFSHCAAQGGSNIQVCGWNPSVWPFKWKL